jgi:peptidoglycan/xylan/chitin deacetylase (PgdA/CDA1 family)
MNTGAKIKSLLKRGIKGSLAFICAKPDLELPRILTYHSVGERDHEMNVLPEMFQEQMYWLAANAPVISLADAMEGMPGVAITFDDGYRDNLINAAPVLFHLEFPATFFVVPGRLGGMLDHDHDLATSRLMSWDDVLKLQSLGMTIGAHTMTHARLARLDRVAQEYEIAECKAILEDGLGRDVAAFAYPFGSAADYDAISRELVQAAGYDFAVSNRYGALHLDEGRWDARRIWIDRTDSLESFIAKVDGRLDALAYLETDWALRARRGINRTLGAQ